MRNFINAVRANPAVSTPIRAILLFICFGALAACGGGGGGGGGSGAGPAPLTDSVLVRFSDGYGVSQVVGTLDGRAVAGKAYVEDIDNAVDAGVDDVVTVTDNDIALVPSLPSTRITGGTLYEGEITVGGQAVEVFVYIHDSKNVVAFESDDPVSSVNDNFLYTISTLGRRVSNIPTGDMDLSYDGLHIITDDAANSQRGSFTMSVNFADRLVNNLTAAAGSGADASMVTGSNIPINTSHGTFAGGISLSGQYVGGSAIQGRILGDFHGNGATEVSGIYYDTNTTSPTYGGIIVGSRQ